MMKWEVLCLVAVFSVAYGACPGSPFQPTDQNDADTQLGDCGSTFPGDIIFTHNSISLTSNIRNITGALVIHSPLLQLLNCSRLQYVGSVDINPAGYDVGARIPVVNFTSLVRVEGTFNKMLGKIDTKYPTNAFSSLQFVGGNFTFLRDTSSDHDSTFLAPVWTYVGGAVNIQGYGEISFNSLTRFNDLQLLGFQVCTPVLTAITGSLSIEFNYGNFLSGSASWNAPLLQNITGHVSLIGKANSPANAVANLSALTLVGDDLHFESQLSGTLSVYLDTLLVANTVELVASPFGVAVSAANLVTCDALYISSATSNGAYQIALASLTSVGDLILVCDPARGCQGTYGLPKMSSVIRNLTYLAADCSGLAALASVGASVNITIGTARSCVLPKLTSLSLGMLAVTANNGSDISAPLLCGNATLLLNGVVTATFPCLTSIVLRMVTPLSKLNVVAATIIRAVVGLTTTLNAPQLLLFDGNLAYLATPETVLPLLRNVTGALNIQNCQNCAAYSLTTVGLDLSVSCNGLSSPGVSFPSLSTVGSVSVDSCGGPLTPTFPLSLPVLTSTKSLAVTNGGTPDVMMPNLLSTNVIDVTSSNPSANLASGLTLQSLKRVNNITLSGTVYASFNAPNLTTADFITLGDQQLYTFSANRLVNVTGTLSFGTPIALLSLDQIFLPALVRVGSIEICGGGVTKILLNQLRFISGHFKVTGAMNLNTFRMCNLTYVGGNMIFDNVPALSRPDTTTQLQSVTTPMFPGTYSSDSGSFSCQPSGTVTVNTTSCGCSFACIQRAINATFRRNSDTVLLPPGIYTGCNYQLNLQNRDFIMASQVPSDPATLDCTYNGRAFTLSGVGSVITGQDLIFMRGNQTNGGLISATDGAVANCLNCEFRDSVANTTGGAVFLETQNKQAYFIGCHFERNTAFIGGAVTVWNPIAGTLYTFDQSTFINNRAGTDGGALALISDGSTTARVSLFGAKFTGNVAAEYGGAVFANVSADLCNGYFQNNTAQQGGGCAFVHGSGPALAGSITGATFVSNTGFSGGGGVYASALPMDYSTLTFTNNTAPSGDGGALQHTTIYLQFDPKGSSFPAPISLIDVKASGNWAQEGGALRLDAVTDSPRGPSTNVQLINNTATTGNGGGVFATDSTMTFMNVELRDNAASANGGGASFRATDKYKDIIPHDVTVIGGTITGNSALNGGGVDATLAFSIDSTSVVQSNVALAAGGGIYLTLNGDLATGVSALPSGNQAGTYGVNLASDVARLNYEQEPPRSISTGGLFSTALQLLDAFNNSLRSQQAFAVRVSVQDTDAQLDGNLVSAVDSDGHVSFNDLKITARNAGVNQIHTLITGIVGLQDSTNVFLFPINVTACIAGQYTVNITLITCPACPAGTFSTNGLVCDDCPYGTTSLAGSGECTPCPMGTYNAPELDTKQALCIACQGGQIASDDHLSCTNCPVGTYGSQNGGNATECVPCQIGSINGFTGQTFCTFCPLGSYSFATSNALACTPCPANAVCFNSTVTPISGYQFWSPSQAAGDVNPYPTDFHIVECQVAEYCTGAAYPGCKPGIHRTDYACGACEPTYYMVEQRCTKCPDVSILVIVLTLLVNAVFSVYAVYFQTNTSARIKILVFFGQTMSLILKGVELLPPEVTVLWSVFNLGVEWIPGTCLAPLRFYERLAIPLFTPFLPLVWIGVLYIIETYLLDYQADKRTRPCCFKFLDSLLDTTRRQDRYIKALIFILLFCYTPIMSATFSVLNCVETFPGSGDFRLAADTSYSCLSSQYLLFRTIALIVLLVFVVPFPIVLFFATVGLKAKRDLRNLVIRARYGVVYLQYIPELFWWESIMQARKIVVAAIVVLAGSQLASRLLQVFFFSLLLFVQLSLVPFRARSDNRMETAFIVCMLTIAIVLSSGWSNTPVNQRAVGTVPSNTTQALLTAVFLPLILAAYWHAPLFQACCAKTKAGAACGRCRKSERVTRMAAIFTPVFQDAWNEGGSVYGGDDDRSHDFDEVGRERRRSRLASMGPFDGLDLNDLTDMGPAPSLSLGTSNPLFDNSASNLLPSPISTALPLAPAPPPLGPAPPPPLAPAPPPLLPMASGAPLLPPMPPPVPANQE